jgi:hypothetical protein
MLNTSPWEGAVCRAMKVGKEEIMGCLAAVEASREQFVHCLPMRSISLWMTSRSSVASGKHRRSVIGHPAFRNGTAHSERGLYGHESCVRSSADLVPRAGRNPPERVVVSYKRLGHFRVAPGSRITRK